MSAIPAELAKLSMTERIQLVEDLLDSIVAEAPEAIPLTDAQRAERRRRWRACRAESAAAASWSEVRSEILGPNGRCKSYRAIRIFATRPTAERSHPSPFAIPSRRRGMSAARNAEIPRVRSG